MVHLESGRRAKVVPAAAALGVGFVPYSPLGRGFLTGTVRSRRPGDLMTSATTFLASPPRRWKKPGCCRAVSARGRRSEARRRPRSRSAWLLAQGTRLGLPVVPIPGTRKAARIDENIGALSLTQDQLAVLDGAADAVVGSRSADPHWVSEGRE